MADEKHISFANLAKFKEKYDEKLTEELATKVDAVDGKGLSANDFTEELKSVLGSALQVEDLVTYAKKSDISSVFKYKGSKENFSDLPLENEIGDTYDIINADTEHNIDAGDNLTWNGESWDNLSGVLDLTTINVKLDEMGVSIESIGKVEFATDEDIDSLFQVKILDVSNCLVFSSVENKPFSIEINNTTEQIPWDGTIEYSTDGENWAEVVTTANNVIPSSNKGKLYVRGTNNTVISPEGQNWDIITTNATDTVQCVGNIENLLDYESVSNGESPIMEDNCFNSMFSECKTLAKAPDLYATDLSDSCYKNMFSGCTALTEMVTLPATILKNSCYSGMFKGCTSLTDATNLPATELAESCYDNMFEGCTSLDDTIHCPVSVQSDTENITNKGLLGSNTTVLYDLISGCVMIKTRNGQAFTLSVSSTDRYAYDYHPWDGIIEYSTDGEIWSTVNMNQTGERFFYSMNSSSDGILYLRGMNNTHLQSNYIGVTYKWNFPNIEFDCIGNIETLLNWKTVISGQHPRGSYVGLFKNSKIVTAPYLPTVLNSDTCYNQIFENCTSLQGEVHLAKTSKATQESLKVGENIKLVYDIPVSVELLNYKRVLYNVKKYNCVAIISKGQMPFKLKYGKYTEYSSTAPSARPWGSGKLYYSTDAKNWMEYTAHWYTMESSNNGVIYLRGKNCNCMTSVTSTGKNVNKNHMSWYIYSTTKPNFAMTAMNIPVSIYGNIENLLDYEKTSAGERPTMKEQCFDQMFNGWIIEHAPELPATTTNYNCYKNVLNIDANHLDELHLSKEVEGILTLGMLGVTNSNGRLKVLYDLPTDIEYEYKKEEDFVIQNMENVSSDTNFVAFTSADGSDFVLSFRNSNVSYGYEVSTDTINWEKWIEASEVQHSVNGKIYLRGQCSTADGLKIVSDKDNIAVSGNIDSLIDYVKVQNNEQITFVDGAFRNLFHNNDCIVDCSYLKLPSEKIAVNYLYSEMFAECYNLKYPPIILAKEISGQWVCSCMFMSCRSLIRFPDLLATTIGTCGYRMMFSGCVSLKEPLYLPASTIQSNTYQYIIQYTQIKEVHVHKNVTPNATLFGDYPIDCEFYKDIE